MLLLLCKYTPKARIFFLVDLRTLLLYFSRKWKKIIFKLFLLFYPLTLNVICFVEKNNIFFRFCLCIFESDTVKSDCPMQDLKINTACWFPLLV